MGQAANNRGRNASLDQKKERAAGRGTRGSAPEFETPQGHGKPAGAFGNPGREPGAAQPRRSTSNRATKKSN
jgi:hypothetical protein